MITPEQIAVAWLKYAVEWLNKLERKSPLSQPADLLLLKLEKARESNEFKSALDKIDDLKLLSDKSDINEYAEIRLRCGLVAAEMGLFKEAMMLSLDAASKYNKGHNYGVAQWMAGCIQWVLPGKEIDAIDAWRITLKAFDDLMAVSKSQKELYEWYRARRQEMADALLIATEEYKIPPLPPYTRRKKEYDASLSMQVSKPKRSSFSNRKCIVKLFPVIGTIPAGIPLGMLPPGDGEMGIETVDIDGRQHRLFSLLDQSVIQLQPSREYYVLRVQGESMNMASPENICDGDYVLMMAQQSAQNGDIVAVQIVDIDSRATLKRYRIENGKPILLAESDSPEFQFPILQKDFSIRGVALAVLKYDANALAS